MAKKLTKQEAISYLKTLNEQTLNDLVQLSAEFTETQINNLTKKLQADDGSLKQLVINFVSQ